MDINTIIYNALILAKQQISNNAQDGCDIYENPAGMLKIKEQIEKELKETKYKDCIIFDM